MNNDAKMKQVIAVRKDLKMPVGKIATQVAHASMKVFFDKLIPKFRMYDSEDGKNDTNWQFSYKQLLNHWELPNYPFFEDYINVKFTKVCVAVNSEIELDDLYLKAQDLGIHSAMIVDEGLTCFDGVPTKTCVALGPWDVEELNKITGHLKLLY